MHGNLQPRIIVYRNLREAPFPQVYLKDFASINMFNNEVDQRSSGSILFAMTYRYFAPEFSNGFHHTKATDIYSMGCVFFEILVAVFHENIFNESIRTPLCSYTSMHTLHEYLERWRMQLSVDNDELLSREGLASLINSTISMTDENLSIGQIQAF